MRFAVLFVVLFIGLADFAIGGGIEKPGRPKPTCDGVCCPPGEQCVLDEIACINQPCPSPLPRCKDIRPTCRGFECPCGQICLLQEVVCITAPCWPQPTCVCKV